MKKYFNIILILILLIPSVTFGFDSLDFDRLKKVNLTQSLDLNSFESKKPLNRAEMLKWIFFLKGGTEVQANNCLKKDFRANWTRVFFFDVKPVNWFAPYVCASIDADWLEKGRNFNASDRISYLQAGKEFLKLADINISRLRSKEVSQELIRLGVIASENEFFPFEKIDRQTFAKWMLNFMDRPVSGSSAQVSDSEVQSSQNESTSKESWESEEKINGPIPSENAVGGASPNVVDALRGFQGPKPGNSTPSPGQNPPSNPVFQFKPNLPQKDTRATWAWDIWQEINKQELNRESFFAFLKKPHGNEAYAIDRIFLGGARVFDFKNPVHVSRMKRFLKNAHANGFTVEYLDGDSNWVRASEMEKAIQVCQNVVSFNASTSDPEEQFDGIHLDIEPHTLGAEWFNNSAQGSDRYNDEFQNNLLKIFSDCKASILNAKQSMSLAADIPPDYSVYVTDLWPKISGKNTPLDYISIMNYTDSEDVFLKGVKTNLEATSIPLIFGAEISDVSALGLPDTITFYEEGYEEMEKVFDQSKKAFESNSYFAGFSIHYFSQYKKASPKTVSPIFNFSSGGSSSGQSLPVIDSSLINPELNPVIQLPKILMPLDPSLNTVIE